MSRLMGRKLWAGNRQAWGCAPAILPDGNNLPVLPVVRPPRREKPAPLRCLVLAHANVVWGTNPTNQSFEKRFKGTLNLRPLWARTRVGQTGTLVDPSLGLDFRAAWLTFSDAIPLANLGRQLSKAVW
jgi:hypothetical protein